jgi:TPR repeat protein
MSARFTSHLLYLCLLLVVVPGGATGLDDADVRLFQVQLSLAEKGDAHAQYYLGEMHEQGLGTVQNIAEAFKWYAKAAEQGDVWAKRKLAHRAEIEADYKKDQAAESLKLAPPAVIPKTSENMTTNLSKAKIQPVVMVQTNTSAAEEEKIKAARKKRRATVRSMILERIRHPVGEPFE